MTVYEALSILGISSSYDEKELKMVYRKLAKKYHPDNFKDDKERNKVEEKLKQINIAYETLLNNKDKSDYQENIDLVLNYKLEKIEGLKKYQIKKYGQLFPNYVFYINEIIRIFGTKLYNTVREVDCSYNNSLTEILKVYLKFQNEFYQKHNIDEKEVTNRVNYNCSFDEFYEQLLKIKDKYSIGKVFLRKIEEVTEKYKYYAGYDIAREEIEAQKRKKYDENVEKIQKYDMFTVEECYKLMQNFLKQLEDEIKGIFNKAFDIKNEIDNLEFTVYETNDTEIINEYMTLKINFENGQLFKVSLNQIEYVKSMILCKKASLLKVKTANINYYLLHDIQKIELNNNKLYASNLKENIIDDKIKVFIKVKRQNFNEDT